MENFICLIIIPLCRFCLVTTISQLTMRPRVSDWASPLWSFIHNTTGLSLPETRTHKPIYIFASVWHLTMTWRWCVSLRRSTSAPSPKCGQSVCLSCLTPPMRGPWPLSLAGAQSTPVDPPQMSSRYMPLTPWWLFCFKHFLNTLTLIWRLWMWVCWATQSVWAPQCTPRTWSLAPWCVLETLRGAETHVRGTQVSDKWG